MTIYNQTLTNYYNTLYINQIKRKHQFFGEATEDVKNVEVSRIVSISPLLTRPWVRFTALGAAARRWVRLHGLGFGCRR